jgi:hypothetical protein
LHCNFAKRAAFLSLISPVAHRVEKEANDAIANIQTKADIAAKLAAMGNSKSTSFSCRPLIVLLPEGMLYNYDDMQYAITITYDSGKTIRSSIGKRTRHAGTVLLLLFAHSLTLSILRLL